jgi:hypothetical protein
MLTYRHGSESERGGLDIVISLTPDQVAALGRDTGELAEALDTMLVGLAAFRTGHSPRIPAGAAVSPKDRPIETGPAWTEWLIRDLSVLRQRVAGATAAAVRTHARQERSYAALAEAMRVTRSTAQRRRDTVTAELPKAPELWAITYPKEAR